MSTFGSVLRTTTFGESHGGYVGCIVDGIPPRLPLVEADVQPQLDRRRPGQSALTSSRDEKDRVQIVSGTERGCTRRHPRNSHLHDGAQRGPQAHRLRVDAARASLISR